MNQDTKRLKGFLLAALVWLPLAFLGWAVLTQWLNSPPSWLTGWILQSWWPSLFSGTAHTGADWQMLTPLMVPDPISESIGQLVLDMRPRIYGYSLPLFFGLVMATDLPPWERLQQCLMALPVLWLAQVFGIATGLLKVIQFDSGPAGAAAAEAAGLSANAVALCYQFGYLILPVVVPVLAWVLFNRRFLDSLGREEPMA